MAAFTSKQSELIASYYVRNKKKMYRIHIPSVLKELIVKLLSCDPESFFMDCFLSKEFRVYLRNQTFMSLKWNNGLQIPRKIYDSMEINEFNENLPVSKHSGNQIVIVETINSIFVLDIEADQCATSCSNRVIKKLKFMLFKNNHLQKQLPIDLEITNLWNPNLKSLFKCHVGYGDVSDNPYFQIYITTLVHNSTGVVFAVSNKNILLTDTAIQVLFDQESNVIHGTSIFGTPAVYVRSVCKTAKRVQIYELTDRCFAHKK